MASLKQSDNDLQAIREELEKEFTNEQKEKVWTEAAEAVKTSYDQLLAIGIIVPRVVRRISWIGNGGNARCRSRPSPVVLIAVLGKWSVVHFEVSIIFDPTFIGTFVRGKVVHSITLIITVSA